MKRKDQSLTLRQHEVLNLIIEGLENKDIGLALGITEGTVKIHTNVILRKLKCKNKKDVIIKNMKNCLFV